MKRKLVSSTASIYFVAGNKGGVGKSAVARTLIECKSQAAEVEVIDCDTGNPDCAKTFGIEFAFDFNHQNGFFDVVNHLVNVEPQKACVISTPAGLNERAHAHGKSFFDALSELPNELNRPLKVIWVIDDKRDSIEALREFMSAVRGVTIDVVRNLHFAPAHKFELFDSSNTRASLVESGGQVIDFPALAQRVMATLTNERLTVADALTKLQLAERLELKRWWRLVCETYAGAGY